MTRDLALPLFPPSAPLSGMIEAMLRLHFRTLGGLCLRHTA